MASLPQAGPGSGTVGQIVRPARRGSAGPAAVVVPPRNTPTRFLNRSGRWWLGISVAFVGFWSVVVLTGTVDVLDVVDTRASCRPSASCAPRR